MRGVVWSPASKDTNTSVFDPNNATVRRPEFCKWFETDLPLLAAMNAKTVRTPIDFGYDLADCDGGLAILDELYRHGIMVVMTVDDGINDLTRIREAVTFYKDHPAVLAWSLGSEWNLNLYFGAATSIQDAAERTEVAAALIKSLDPNHPVVSSYGDIDIDAPGLRLADTERYVNEVAPSADIWSINAFRGSNFGNLFNQWASISTKPMFFGEFGTDAFRSTTLTPPPAGRVDEQMQADWTVSLWDDLFFNLSANQPSRVAIGGTVFEWNDEWWKVQPPGSQQTGGFELAGGHPDNFANEEYFGIVDIDREPRAIYDSLQRVFDPTYEPDPRIIDFCALPDRLTTNLGDYFVSGQVRTGETAMVDGEPLVPDAGGYFVKGIALSEGENVIALVIETSDDDPITCRTVIDYDPDHRTGGRRLLYVDWVAEALPGTVVIDLDARTFLGLIKDRHVRGIAPDGRHLYMQDRSVFSTADHQELNPPASPLAFSGDIAHNCFLVSPVGDFLYSANERLDLATNTLLENLPVSLCTGTSFGGAPIPGGSDISDDGSEALCCLGGRSVTKLDLGLNTSQTIGLAQDGAFQSDLTLSPDGTVMARSTYGGQSQFLVGVYDATTFARLASVPVPGDFGGELVFSSDGNYAIAGAAGNPRFGGGGVSVIDLTSFEVVAREQINLADNLVISERDEIFATSGSQRGVEAFALGQDGSVTAQESYVLGINGFVATTGRPANDEIWRLVLKRATQNDTDGDGIPDAEDNCIETANPNQRDTNGDGYGNLCDGDLNDDGATNTLDLQIYRAAHRTCSGDAAYTADADFNGDACINTLDLNIYGGLHRKPPGPSCCGT